MLSGERRGPDWAGYGALHRSAIPRELRACPQRRTMSRFHPRRSQSHWPRACRTQSALAICPCLHACAAPPPVPTAFAVGTPPLETLHRLQEDGCYCSFPASVQRRPLRPPCRVGPARGLGAGRHSLTSSLAGIPAGAATAKTSCRHLVDGHRSTAGGSACCPHVER